MHIESIEPRLLLSLWFADPGFGSGGEVDALVGAIRAIRQQSDGAIVVAGGQSSEYGLAEVSAAGELLSVSETASDSSVDDTAFAPDGKAIFVGRVSNGIDDELRVWRIKADGSADTTFGTNGSTLLPKFADQALFGPDGARLKLAPDGKIVVAASIDLPNGDFDTLAVARLTANGAMDSSLDGDGERVTNLAQHRPHSIDVDVAGKIVVAGHSLNGGDGSFVVRMNSDGSFDNSFASNGVLDLEPGLTVPGADAVQILSGGKILLAGSGNDSDHPITAGRLNSDGSFDNTFSGDGRVFLAGAGLFQAMTLDDAGNIFIAGFNNSLPIFKLTADGALDASFGDGGLAQIPLSREFEQVNSLAIQSDGKILVGRADGSLLRVAPRPDLELAPNGILIITGTAGADTVDITQSGDNVVLTRNGVSTSYPANSVTGSDISSLDGDDHIVVSTNISCTVSAGAGNDSITTADESDMIDSGDGNDTIMSGNGNDTISAGGGSDSVTVADGDCSIDLGNGDNTLLTGAGQKNVNTGSGNDRVTLGGNGTIDVGDGDNFVQFSMDPSFLTTGNDNDTIIGSPLADSLFLGGGNDSVVTGDGDDEITTFGDSPTIIGGDGNDKVIDTKEESGHIEGGAGNDRFELRGSPNADGGDGDDSIALFSGQGTLSGGAGNDLIRAASDAGKHAIIHGGDGDDTLFAGAGDDSVFGEAGRDVIHAGLGNDFLSGGGGRDKLFGQAGDDTIQGGRGNDLIDGGDGADHVIGGAGDDFTIRDPLDDVLEVENQL